MAAVMPMWLMQPRDYDHIYVCRNDHRRCGCSLLVVYPTMNLPVYTGFKNAKMGDMFPILFVTAACGAVSGFHSLVSSGTFPRPFPMKSDMLKVGYGNGTGKPLAVLAFCGAGAGSC